MTSQVVTPSWKQQFAHRWEWNTLGLRGGRTFIQIFATAKFPNTTEVFSVETIHSKVEVIIIFKINHTFRCRDARENLVWSAFLVAILDPWCHNDQSKRDRMKNKLSFRDCDNWVVQQIVGAYFGFGFVFFRSRSLVFTAPVVFTHFRLGTRVLDPAVLPHELGGQHVPAAILVDQRQVESGLAVKIVLVRVLREGKQTNLAWSGHENEQWGCLGRLSVLYGCLSGCASGVSRVAEAQSGCRVSSVGMFLSGWKSKSSHLHAFQ